MHRRQGRDPVQRPGSRTDAAASGRQPGEDDRRPEPVSAGLGRVLRLQPVARVAIAGWLDPTAPALRRLGPVEDARSALSRAPAAQGLRTVGQCGYLQPKGTVAAELLGSAASRLHQSALPSSGSDLHGKASECLIRRTAVVRTRMPGGVGGVASRDVPLSRLTGASTLLLSLQVGTTLFRLTSNRVSSRRPLRGLLRMRSFLNAIKGLPHAEECPKSLPQA